jgi:cell division septation protein DedD
LSREFSTVEPGTIASSSLRDAVSANERRHQFGDERILSIVREGEAGHRVAELCETHGISAPMYYLWKARYGGVDLSELQRLRHRAVTVRTAVTAAVALAIFGGGFAVGRALSEGNAAAPRPEPAVAQLDRPLFGPAATPPPTPPAAVVAVVAVVDDAGASVTTSADTGEEGPLVSRPAATEVTQPLALPAPDLDAGYAVQVAAFPDVREADALLLRLTAKGYSTYVLSKGGPSALHRVRIGPFKTRHEAEAAAGRLATEEQFRPWITR